MLAPPNKLLETDAATLGRMRTATLPCVVYVLKGERRGGPRRSTADPLSGHSLDPPFGVATPDSIRRWVAKSAPSVLTATTLMIAFMLLLACRCIDAPDARCTDLVGPRVGVGLACAGLVGLSWWAAMHDLDSPRRWRLVIGTVNSIAIWSVTMKIILLIRG